MSAIYNDTEPFAAAWMRALVEAGHISPGVVDERSIEVLTPADVAGPGQRHFFAGIGGWSYALRLAGVPDDADVWTGSCPCQPFSQAGKRGGTSDARHLWPAWFALIRECRPATIFGEQVASLDGLAWLDAVYADLEGCGYAVGSTDLCAAGVGAPHIRQRLYFVAHASGERCEGQRLRIQPGRLQLGNAGGARSRRHTRAVPGAQTTSESERLEYRRVGDEPVDAGADDIVADTDRERRRRRLTDGEWQTWGDASRGHQGLEWIQCPDGKRRPTKPGIQPLATGVPNRLGALSGSGNSIVPQVAATFISAAFEAMTAQLTHVRAVKEMR